MEPPRGDQLIQQITENIQNLSSNVVELEHFVEKIGRPDDTEDVKETLNNLIQSSNALSKHASSQLKQLVTLSNEQRQYRVPRERLIGEYMSVLNRLQSVQKRAASKEKAQIRTVTDEEEKLANRGQQIQADDPLQQIQIQEQRRQNLQELRERNQALFQLEGDINDVNQIFKDLARIVHDQGEMVDSIESNVEHASIFVEQGHSNVQQALHYQNQARKKKIILFIFLVALLFIVGLTLYLWAR
ncbi:Syntaxin-12 [Aphelenchoides bicaudatus]|nr:Syntaxin-12 [Aphelenchoides bicaudatus]